MVDDSGALADQLEATRAAVEKLAEAVEDLAKRDRMRKVILTVLGVVVASLVALTVYSIVYFVSTNNKLETLTQNSFLFTCETNNNSRETLREANTSNAEALILVTNADTRNPAAADAYRKITAENNAKISDRDCRAELESISG